MKQAFSCLALIAVAWLACEAAWTTHVLRPKLQVTITNIDRATIAAGAAASNVEKASREWELASRAQMSETTKALSHVNVVAGQLSSFISKTDASLNSVFIPYLTKAVNEQNAALLETQKQVQEGVNEISKSAMESQKVLASANEQISNPAIHESVDALAVASKNVAVTSEQAAATMTDVRKAVDYEVAQLMAPVKKIKTVILFAAQVAGKFLGY